MNQFEPTQDRPRLSDEQTLQYILDNVSSIDISKMQLINRPPFADDQHLEGFRFEHPETKETFRVAHSWGRFKDECRATRCHGDKEEVLNISPDSVKKLITALRQLDLSNVPTSIESKDTPITKSCHIIPPSIKTESKPISKVVSDDSIPLSDFSMFGEDEWG